MNIYLLKNTEHGFSEFGGFVIAALSEKNARKMAKNVVKKESYATKTELVVWMDDKIVPCVKIGTSEIEKEQIFLAIPPCE